MLQLVGNTDQSDSGSPVSSSATPGAIRIAPGGLGGGPAV